MTDNKLLFFKEIENCFTLEGIKNSQINFTESYYKYGSKFNDIHIEERGNDIILHLPNDSCSSWLSNFERNIEALFEKAKILMEEVYIKEEIKGFKDYVEKSLRNILRLDAYGFTKKYINKLIDFFQTKYNFEISIAPFVANQKANPYLRLKGGLRKSDITELYNLSIDDYIEYENLDVDDFFNVLSGDSNKNIVFKCSTAEMVEYIRNLLPILEKGTIKNIYLACFFTTSNNTILKVSNYHRYKTTNKKSKITLSQELLDFFTKLQNRPQ